MSKFNCPGKYHQTIALWLVMLFLGFTVTPLFAKEQNANPGINNYYYDAEYEHWVSVFERPGREVYDKRHEIVAALNLKPGMHVADVGAGTGFYAYLFSKQVGESGRVYAIDISENFIEHIQQTANSQGLHNIRGIVNTQQSIKLPPESVDLLFLCDTYHHFEYPQTMLASISRALRRNGQLVVIDFRKQKGISSNWVMSHVRANETAVINEIETAGFKLVEQSTLLNENFFLKFVKINE